MYRINPLKIGIAKFELVWFKKKLIKTQFKNFFPTLSTCENLTHIIHSELPYGCNSFKNYSFFYWKVPLPKELNNIYARDCHKYPSSLQIAVATIIANASTAEENTLCHNDPYSESSGNLNCPRRTLPLGTTFSRRQKWCVLWELCKMKKLWIFYIQPHMCTGGAGWLGRCLCRVERNSEINIKRKDSSTWTTLKLQGTAAWWGNEDWPQWSLRLCMQK